VAGTTVVLTLLGDDELSADADRVAAAAGLRVMRAAEPARMNWLGAAAILVDEHAALRCVREGLPRREGVVLIVAAEPSPSAWSAAVAVGARSVVTLPAQEAALVRMLSEAVEAESPHRKSGPLIAVVPGRGGGGASVFAAALAMCAPDALLVDLDPCGGGLDLLLGIESAPGLRWPDLSAPGGRFRWTAVRDALPQRGGTTVLSAARACHEVDAEVFVAVAEAGRRGGATVVCDVPRQFGAAAAHALELADLVVVITTCDVRAITAAAAVTGAVRVMNRNVGLVVRGPAPGGLSVREAVEVVAAPLLAALRPEPLLSRHLEQGGLRLRRRSGLAAAARTVLECVDRAPGYAHE
jgi:secretion/DNA translocation related CpaE-like protein